MRLKGLVIVGAMIALFGMSALVALAADPPSPPTTPTQPSLPPSSGGGGGVTTPGGSLYYCFFNRFLSDPFPGKAVEFEFKACDVKHQKFDATVTWSDGSPDQKVERVVCGRWRIPHIYYQTGTYTAKVTVNGQSCEDTIEVAVKPPKAGGQPGSSPPPGPGSPLIVGPLEPVSGPPVVPPPPQDNGNGEIVVLPEPGQLPPSPPTASAPSSGNFTLALAQMATSPLFVAMSALILLGGVALLVFVRRI